VECPSDTDVEEQFNKLMKFLHDRPWWLGEDLDLAMALDDFRENALESPRWKFETNVKDSFLHDVLPLFTRPSSDNPQRQVFDVEVWLSKARKEDEEELGLID
jgi:hypothetical protein